MATEKAKVDAAKERQRREEREQSDYEKSIREAHKAQAEGKESSSVFWQVFYALWAWSISAGLVGLLIWAALFAVAANSYR